MHSIYSSILTEVRVNPKYIMNSSQHQATPMINIGIYNLKTGKNIQPAVHENLNMRTRAHIYSHACTYEPR